MEFKLTSIHQVLPSLVSFDAISHHAMNIKKFADRLGISGKIFAENFDVEGCEFAESIDNMLEQLTENDVLLYHHSIGSCLPQILLDAKCRVILVYHNITPPQFFDDGPEKEACLLGLRQLDLLKSICVASWAVSEYNSRELVDRGFSKPYILPILRDYFGLSSGDRCHTLERKLKLNHRKKLVFVGRVVPNKGHHNLLVHLQVFKETFTSEVQLILPGKILERYFQKLLKLSKSIGLKVSTSFDTDESADVIFPGILTNHELATVYQTCDLYYSLSAHEGFGVPFIEAMTFGMPIVAHDCSAVAETCGSGAVIVDAIKDPSEPILKIYQMLFDEKMREEKSQAAKDRASDFMEQKLFEKFVTVLELTFGK